MRELSPLVASRHGGSAHKWTIAVRAKPPRYPRSLLDLNIRRGIVDAPGGSIVHTVLPPHIRIRSTKRKRKKRGIRIYIYIYRNGKKRTAAPMRKHNPYS